MTATTPTAAERHRQHQLRIWAALVVVYIVWGSTYFAIRVMVDSVPPLLGTAARFELAVLVLVAWLAVRRQLGRLRVGWRPARHAGAVGALLLMGGTGLVGIAEQDMPSGITALIIAAVPLMVIVLRRLVGERVRLVTLVSVLVGFVGIALLVLPGSSDGAVQVGAFALLLVASLFWSVGSFLAGRIQMPHDRLVSSVVQMAAGAAVCTAVAAAMGEFGEVEPSAWSAASLWAILYLALFGSVLAFSAYAWLLQHAPIQLVSTYAFVNPAVAVLLGTLFLDESLTPAMLLAGVVITASVAFTIRSERPRRDAAAGP